MAAVGSLHTVQWKTRENILDIEVTSAFRSEVYKAYHNSSLFDKKQPYYLNWATRDVNELLNTLRDEPIVNRKNLSKSARKLADFLIVDFESHQKKVEERNRRLEVERKKYVGLLNVIARRVMGDSGRYGISSFLSKYTSMYSCRKLIPRGYVVGKLVRYSDQVPLIYDERAGVHWEWVRMVGDRPGLFMGSRRVRYWR
ncbi:MAG: hypothetical protein Harvfovirus19_3 [Harvfovirus sp.]|uniref:Uncharacterized protein n=1 Tax=Harvfovirus sp. TaxID=2487768 RepID=A0A3G5A1R4_9VIRU|nr:MAG: hypothetical protein Harvfovirus19_3 [Harvfovirus sp.]